MENKNGKPVNTKSMLAFLFNQMDMLNKGEVSVNEACAQAKLAAQANNLLNYELKRAVVQIRLKELGETNDCKIREIESKSFDNTI